MCGWADGKINTEGDPATTTPVASVALKSSMITFCVDFSISVVFLTLVFALLLKHSVWSICVETRFLPVNRYKYKKNRHALKFNITQLCDRLIFEIITNLEDFFFFPNISAYVETHISPLEFTMRFRRRIFFFYSKKVFVIVKRVVLYDSGSSVPSLCD